MFNAELSAIFIACPIGVISEVRWGHCKKVVDFSASLNSKMLMRNCSYIYFMSMSKYVIGLYRHYYSF